MRTPARILLPVLAVAAGLTASTGSASANVNLQISGPTLTLAGDDGVNKVTFRAKPADPSVLEIDVDGDGSIDADAPRAQLKLFQIFALGGDDDIRFDASNGPPTAAGATVQIFGAAGDDKVVGSTGIDQIFGGPGKDDITGGVNSDVIDAGTEDDTINWFAGDDNDVIVGGAGSDAFRLFGSNTHDDIGVRSLDGQNTVRVSNAVDGAQVDLTDVEQLASGLNGGDDSFTARDGLPAFFFTNLSGGPGADTLTGGDGRDLLAGGEGDDTVATGAGSDTAFWSAGEGKDQIDMGADEDNLVVRGGIGDDKISIEPVSGGTGIGDSVGGAVAKGTERAIVFGSRGNDTIAAVDVPTRLVLAGDDGDDTITGAGGNDGLSGGNGADHLSGAGGDDDIDGAADADVLTGGAGVDTFSCGIPDADTITDLVAEDVLGQRCDAPHARIDVPPEQGQPAPADQTAPSAPAQPAVPALPAGFLGFPKPKIKASLKALNVTVRNSHSQPITVRLSGSERDGLKKAAGLKAVTRTIPAGGKVTYKLATPKKLKTRLAKQLATRRRVTRRPALTLLNTATGGKLTVKPKLTVKRRRAR